MRQKPLAPGAITADTHEQKADPHTQYVKFTDGGTAGGFVRMFSIDGITYALPDDLSSGGTGSFLKKGAGPAGQPIWVALVAADLGTGTADETKYLRGDLTWQIGPTGEGTTVTTTPYSVTAADYAVLVDATAGAITVDLPAAADADRRVLHVKKTDSSANAVTIDASGAETIEDATTQSLVLQGESLMLMSDGTQWWVL